MTGEYWQEKPDLKRIDIVFVDAPYHDASEPSPIAGLDMPTFRNYLTRALSGDPDVPPGILAVVRLGAAQAERADKKKDQVWWEHFFWLQARDEQRRAMDDLIRRYEEMAAFHHERAEAAHGRMREAVDRLAAIDEFLSGAKDVLEESERTGKLDREKVIGLLRARGVAADPSTSDGQLAILLAKQQAAARNERDAWSKQYERSKTEATNEEEMERECRKKAEELVQKRDEIRSHGYDPREESLRLRQVTEEYQRDIQRKAKDIEGLRSENVVAGLNELQRDTFHQARDKQATSEVSDFEALAAGALSGEFARVAKGDPTPTPLPPLPPGSNGGAPTPKNSFG